MTKGTKDKGPDARIVYADIINLPHWQSPTRPHMSLYDRSAQFASCKALSGYEDMVSEEVRLTENQVELEEYEIGLTEKVVYVMNNDIFSLKIACFNKCKFRNPRFLEIKKDPK